MDNQAYSRDAEQAVLSAMMMTGSGKTSDKVSKILTADHFFLVEHQQIWQAIQSLRLKGQDIDPVMVAETDEGIESDYLFGLCESFASAANTVAYANLIRDKAQERIAVGALYEAVSTLSDKSIGEWQHRLKKAEDCVMTALSQSQTGSSGLVHIEGIAKLWTSDLIDRIEGVNPIKGFETGIHDLDNLLDPKLLVPGSLVVVGARPKMGKSALLTMFADQFAAKLKLHTAIFSMEMPSGQVWERLLTGGTNISPDKFFKPLSPEDYYSVTQYSGDRMKCPLYIDDTPAITISHIKAEARKLSRKGKVGLICVDYLTLMDAPKADRNDLSYGKITKELKNLARELGCVVLLLTQLNRKIEDRKVMDRKPMPSDSRDTGQIEQDCDVWIGLFRAGAYVPECPNPQLTELVVRLNRHGKTGSVFLNMEHGYFSQMSQSLGVHLDEKNQAVITPQKQQGGFNG
jgi:replicative DNA helicase